MNKRLVLALTSLVLIHPLTASADPPEAITMDDRFAMVASRVPTFGGAYLDGGTLVILLTEPSEEAGRQSRDALVEIMGDAFAAEEYVVKEATYSFGELKRWYESMRDIHRVAPDLVFTDIDEKRNRIMIGVEDPDRYRAAVEAKLDRLGIPQDAVLIEESSPICLHTLPSRCPQPRRGPTSSQVGLLAILLLSAGGLLLRRRRRIASSFDS